MKHLQFSKRWLIFPCAIFLFSFWIGKIPLWSSDEGRFGEIAREMLETGDFTVPHFNYVPYLDKPVLPPALTAAAYAVFGIGPFAARFTSWLAALLGVFLFHRFATKIWGSKTADFGTILLVTTIGYVLVGRFAVIDMLMTFFLSMTLFCFATAYFKRKPRYYLYGYVLMGLAFLTKGLIGIVLPFLVFGSFLIWVRSVREIRNMRLGWGILIMTAIGLPWCIAISRKVPDFFDVFIVQQHFSRFTTGSYGRKRPFWFFIPVLIATAFPWTFFLPAAMVRAFSKENPKKSEAKFLICWIAMIFLFFSIPKSKLPYYILPVSMPIALLIADFLVHGVFSKPLEGRIKAMWHWTWKILWILFSIAVAGFSGYLLFWKHPKPEVTQLKPVLAAGIFWMVAGILSSYVFFRAGKARKAVLSLAAMVYGGLILCIVGMKMISPSQSTEAYAAELLPILKEGDIVSAFSSPDRFSDFPFYLKRRVVIVGADRGTLAEQSRKLNPAEEKKYFLETGEFVPLFRKNEQKIYCLMEDENLSALEREGLKEYKIIKRDSGKVLISN